MRGRGQLGDNCDSVVRASISKRTPFIYLAFEKTDPFIRILDGPSFFYLLIAGSYTNTAVNSLNTKGISSLEKSLSEKYVHKLGCQKRDLSYTKS